MAYATEAEYVNWAGEDAPADIVRLLEVASLTIDNHITRPYLSYNESTGQWEAPDPLPAHILDALSKATCALAWSLSETEGIEQFTNVSIGSLSVAVKDAGYKPTPAALGYLRNAGLTYRGVASGQRPQR